MRVHIEGGITGRDTKVFVVDRDGTKTMLRGVQSVDLHVDVQSRNTTSKAVINMVDVTTDLQADASLLGGSRNVEAVKSGDARLGYQVKRGRLDSFIWSAWCSQHTACGPALSISEGEIAAERFLDEVGA